MTELLKWDMYEISSEKHPLVDVKFRGRLRKFALQEGINLLTDNAKDAPGNVRVAVTAGYDIESILVGIRKIAPDATLTLVKANVANPVLTKLSINDETRYTIE